MARAYLKAANEALYTYMRLNSHYGWAKDLPHEQRLRDCLGMEPAEGPRRFIWASSRANCWAGQMRHSETGTKLGIPGRSLYSRIVR